jgi:hypothetical protein
MLGLGLLSLTEVKYSHYPMLPLSPTHTDAYMVPNRGHVYVLGYVHLYAVGSSIEGVCIFLTLSYLKEDIQCIAVH